MSNAPRSHRTQVNINQVLDGRARGSLERAIIERILLLLLPVIDQAWTPRSDAYIAVADADGQVLAYFRSSCIEICDHAPITPEDLIGLDVEPITRRNRDGGEWPSRMVKFPGYVPRNITHHHTRKTAEICPVCHLTKTATGNCWC